MPGQAAKFSVAKPVVVKMETTWNAAILMASVAPATALM